MKLHPFLLALPFLFSCSESEDEKDMTYPTISDQIEAACPADCQTFQRGDEIEVCFLLGDDIELGSYNIEIHNNFDHHTHSTSANECEMDEEKDPVNPWIFNQDYAIPAGSTSYEAHQFLQIPEDVDPGDYHFMLRLTDRAGWQQLKAVSIKIK